MIYIKSAISLAIVVNSLLLVVPARLPAQPVDEVQRYRLAKGYEASRDHASAARVFLELYQGDGGSNVYFQGVVRNQMALLRFVELLPLVEERALRFRRDVDLGALYANLLHRTGSRDKAMAEWGRLLELNPTDSNAYLVVAASQIELNLTAEAIATLEAGRSAIGSPRVYSGKLARLYSSAGRIEEATEEYLNILEGGPRQLNAVMVAMGLYTAQPDLADRSIAVVKQRVDEQPKAVQYLELLSWLYNERGDLDGAFDVAVRIDHLRSGNGSGIFAYADRAMREEKYDAAIRAYEYFLANYPEQNPLTSTVTLAYTRALEGGYNLLAAPTRDGGLELLKRYEKIALDNPRTNVAAEALLASARLLSGRLDEPLRAIETLHRLLSDIPNAPVVPEARLLLGEVLIVSGQIDEADTVFRALAHSAIGNPHIQAIGITAELRRAEILFYRGKFEAAEGAFLGLTNDPGSPAANDAISYLFMIRENQGRGEGALHIYAEARLLMLQRDWKLAVTRFNDAISASTTRGLTDEILFRRADAERALGDAASAVATLMTIVDDSHDGTLTDRALFNAADIAEHDLHNKVRATDFYTKLITEFPSSTMVARSREKIRELRGDTQIRTQ